MLVVFATGVTMLLSALYVRFRDVQPIWEVALQLLFYGSPIIYVIERRAGERARAGRCSTRSPSVLTQWRHAVIDQDAPTAGTAIGGIELLLVPVAIVVAVFALRLLGLHARDAADRREPLSHGRGAQTTARGRRRCASASTRSSASSTSARRGPTPRSRRPRTAATGSTAGTST